MVDHDIEEFVALERIQRCVHLDLLIIWKVQDLIILVEYLVIVQVSRELVLDQVVSDLDDVIVVVDVTVHQSVCS